MTEPDHYHANLQRGSLLLDQDRPKEALPFLQAAIAANPHAAYGYAELARCWNEIPAQRGKAIGAIDRSIALEPNASYFYGRKGWFLVCLMKYRAAMTAAKQGLAINPTCPTSLNALANAHTKLNRWKKAEEVCRQILALNPYDAPGLNLLAQALRHQGKWKETREVVARLLADMPNNAFGHANAGFAALAACDHLRANEHFLTSLQMNPHFDLARRGLIQSLRARIWILRFNTRMICAINRPATFLNIVAGLAIVAVLFGLILGASILLDSFFPQKKGSLVGVLFMLPLLYLYLSGLVGLLGNFLLMFDPLGRHALTRQEKAKALVPAIAFLVVVFYLLAHHAWPIAAGLVAFFLLLALTIQFPLIRDRWQRRHEHEANS